MGFLKKNNEKTKNMVDKEKETDVKDKKEDVQSLDLSEIEGVSGGARDNSAKSFSKFW